MQFSATSPSATSPNPTSAIDYGPVAVSRLKDESKAIFEALKAGRRVPISRRGEVVAVIEPARVDRFAEELATFAIPGSAELPELTATELSQGSPAEFVRKAESGTRSFVTRNNKVYGVLVAQPQSAQERPWETLDFYRAREAELAAYEQANPGASTEDLLTQTERLTTRAVATATAVPEWTPLPEAVARTITSSPVAGPDRHALEDALATMITTLQQASGAVEHATTLLTQASSRAVGASH